MATAAPGFNPALLQDPSLYGDQLAIQQRQALAQALMEKGMGDLPGIQMAGRVAVGNSPFEGMAKIAQLLSGQNLQGQVNAANQDLGQRQFGANLANVGGYGQPGQGADPRGGGNFPRLGGDTTGVTTAMLLNSDPTKYAELMTGQNAPSDLVKQLAAQGIYPGDPRYATAMSQAQAKGNYIAPEEVKQGNTTLDPYTHKPIAFGVKVPDNAQPTFGPDGRMASVDAVPGAQGVVTGNRIAETGNDIVDVPLQNGQTQKMTKAQFLAQIGGGATPYKFDVAPGTEGQFRDALVKSGDRAAVAAFDARGGMTTGQSTASKESATTTAGEVAKRNQSVIADANSAPLDIESLTRMNELATKGNFGPGASNVAKWKAFAAQVPGIGLIADPTTLQDQQTNVSLMKKYMSNMAGRMSGSSGTGTDARLQNAIDSLPNDTAPDAAIKIVAPLLIAQRTARLDEGNLRQKLGTDPEAIQAFEGKWRGAYNPLAYEASLATKGMTPQQAAAYVQRTYTPAQAAQIQQSRAQLRALGVQF